MTTQEAWINYSEDVKHFIISKVKNVYATDDVLQDTFIKVHAKLHTLKNTEKIKPWIFTIARNSVMDYFKDINKNTNELDFDIPTENNSYEQEHTEKDCLNGILVSLPKKYRDPLFLSDIKGLKQQEVAKQLNQTLSTTKSQIQRARKLIAKGFMDCCGFVINEEGNLVGEIKDKVDCKICNNPRIHFLK